MTTSADIIRIARSLEGVPVVHGHYHRNPGLDCYGSLRLIAIESGLYDARDENPAMKEFIGYGRWPDPERMQRGLDRFLTCLAPRGSTPEQIFAVARPSDVLWMRPTRRRPGARPSAPRHLAVMVSPDEIGHALASVGRFAIHRLDAAYRAQAVAAYSWPGLTDR